MEIVVWQHQVGPARRAHIYPSTVKAAQIQADRDAPPGVKIVSITRQDRKPVMVWEREDSDGLYGFEWYDEPTPMDEWEEDFIEWLNFWS